MATKGNFIEEMYLVKMLRKSDNTVQRYFGINEVVKGSDFAQMRAYKKYETHIEKVLEYPIKNYRSKEVSHMSLQSFARSLKRSGKLNHDDEDDRYYPFVLEFETNKKKEMEEVYIEAMIYINSLHREYNVDIKDIVIVLNNNKSVYVWVNPKVFGLKQGKNIHNIYYRMYKHFKDDLELKHVDESVVSSGYRLIKTPGSYYKGGYVVDITLQELGLLMYGELTRSDLTKKQRDIRRLNLPGIASTKLATLYKNCKREVESNKKNREDNALTLPGETKICNRPCINAILNLGMVEKGNRNDLLVSLAIGLRDAGFKVNEIEETLEAKAIEWGHDEKLRAVRNKVNTIIRQGTNFSCQKAKNILEEVGINSSCSNCYKESSEGIWIARNIIEKLYMKKASIRHFELYVNLEKEHLLNKEFTLAEVKTTERTLKDLAKILDVKLSKKGDLYKLSISRSKAKYKLPCTFLEDTFYTLRNNVKQYLYMLVNACDGNEKTAYISMSYAKLAEYLGYENERSIYNLINKFENLGLLRVNKKQGVTLFFKSYKVIDINKVIEEEMIQEGIQEEKLVVNGGVQLRFELNGQVKEEKRVEIIELKFSATNKKLRGSPGYKQSD